MDCVNERVNTNQSMQMKGPTLILQIRAKLSTKGLMQMNNKIPPQQVFVQFNNKMPPSKIML